MDYFLEYNFIITEEYFAGNSRDDGNDYNGGDDHSYNDDVDDENFSSNSNFYDKVRCICYNINMLTVFDNMWLYFI